VVDGWRIDGSRKYNGCIISFGYKLEIRGFDFEWCHWKFSLTHSFRPHLSLLWSKTVTEMSKRNSSWSKGGRFVGLTILLLSCADCLEIWEPETPGTLSACNWNASISFGNTVLTFSWTDWLRKFSYTSAGVDRYRPTVIPSSCGVEVRLVIAWAGEEGYSFQDGV